jgi:hypothetical protein
MEPLLHVSGSEGKSQGIWKALSDAGLVEIEPTQFPDRINEVRHVAMGLLSELLELQNCIAERESVAHSLGTLKVLQNKLGKPDQSG